MTEWPSITDPELLARLGMEDAEFLEFVQTLIAALPPRDYDEAVLRRALAYPWERPAGSYRLTEAGVEPLIDLSPEQRQRLVVSHTAAGSGRLPILAFGANGAPAALKRKFAHFPDREDREVLVLTGHLHDFDVGVSPQPAFYGSLPATLFPSPGTAVRAALLWVTPAQFTQLTWSELSYRLGRLRARFEVDETADGFEEVLVFVSRFGAFCVDGRPVALAAIPATARSAEALTQEELLDTVAALALGPGAGAETLVRAIFANFGAIVPQFVEAVHPLGRPFASERWAPLR